MKNRLYSESIANAINTFLTEDDWFFSFDKEHGLFQFQLLLQGKIKIINYIIEVKKDKFIVYAISPLGVDENDQAMMSAMAEFVCRVNYDLIIGNFDLDMHDGEIRFKYFVDCNEITPTIEMVCNSIHFPATMFKRYGGGIVDVLFGNSTAKEAIDKCEKATVDELRKILTEADDNDSQPELRDLIERLAECLDTSDDIETELSSESQNELTHIKTDLFGTEGANN